MSCGCKGNSAKSTHSPTQSGSSPFTNWAVGAGAGTLDMYSSDLDRVKTFTLNWEHATGSAKDKSHYTVDAEKVSGQLFQEGKPVAIFSADGGSADKGSGTLSLKGNVKITSVDNQSSIKGTTLSCESVSYAGSDEIIKAKDNVYVRGKDAEMGPFAEIWCSNDLSEVASPDAFVPVRHNHASTPKL